MTRLSLIFSLLLFTILAESQPQRIGQWKSYTDMKSVRQAAMVGSSIWAATGGGVFVYDTATGLFRKFSNTDGLSSNDIQCIVAEPGKRVWAGGADGFLNVYDLTTGLWTSIDANRSSDRSRRGVQDLFLKGDTMFVASVFGMIPFKISKWEFGDTYASFGFSSSFLVTSVRVAGGRMFVGTDRGLAVASLTAPNSWTTYTTIPGLSSNAITKLALFKDTLLIATTLGLGFYYNGSLGAVASLAGKAIADLSTADGKFGVLSNESTGFIVEQMSSLAMAPYRIASGPGVQGSSLLFAPSLWVSTTTIGLARAVGSGWESVAPNGPQSNFFNSLAVDEKGVVWAASGSTAHAGFYRYDQSLPENVQWKNFSGAEYFRVSLGAKGSVWMSSWGDGIVEVTGDTVRRKLNAYSTPSFPGTGTGSLSKIVIPGMAGVDGDGKTWISNRVSGNGRSLLRLDNDSIATFFDNQYNTTDGWFHTMVIDRHGTKWLAGDLPWEPHQLGLYFFNENTSLSGVQTISGWGHLSNSDGLKSNIVLCFAVDLDGSLWIGTGSGVTILSNPQNPKQQTTSYPLLGRFIETIAVDAVNNKWIGTNEGVFVVNADGTQLLQTYDYLSTQGQLLDNEVRSIALDQTRGIAYFGTEKGLSSLSIEPVQTNKSYTELKIAPNPFIIPCSDDQKLEIRNLIPSSTIKVMTVHGTVVAQFEAQGGGRAFWDGRDKNGTPVSSGIYFIIGSAENGSETVTGKVAVIRH